MEPADSILSSNLYAKDSEWLHTSGQDLHTCLSRHLWLQQDGPKQPLDIPYRCSKVMTDRAYAYSYLCPPLGRHMT